MSNRYENIAWYSVKVFYYIIFIQFIVLSKVDYIMIAWMTRWTDCAVNEYWDLYSQTNNTLCNIQVNKQWLFRIIKIVFWK